MRCLLGSARWLVGPIAGFSFPLPVRLAVTGGDCGDLGWNGGRLHGFTVAVWLYGCGVTAP